MRYKLLGKSGLRVSELALGTMTFGEDWGWGASREVSQQIFEAYANAGGNFVDTANNYTNGTSEKFVGEFIHSDRHHFVLATKFTLSERPSDPNFGGNQRKNLMRSVEGSLKRLNTDFIDLLWLHAWDGLTPVEEVLRGLDDLVRSGKVNYIGISDSPAWIVSQANAVAELRGWSSFVALQLPYSLAGRAPERDLLPMAKAHQMSVTAWGILGGGVLTGKYNKDNNDPKRYNGAGEKSKGLAELVMAVAEGNGRSPAQVAINWVRQQQEKSSIIPIIGARTLVQVEDNLAALEWELSHDELNQLSEASPIALGFPHDFLADDEVRHLIFGDTFAMIDNHRE
ncbi:MAG: aldo/keto reductase [Anaerolineaceae bacterium]|nr:aldo/keto reductase [Anaerolineaceae bacterium]